ncbi:MAG: UDP-glucose 4-epimerase GalE [Acidiferrobacteraceae bacterium]
MTGRGGSDRKRVLVTGGAGYIGSHTVWQLVEGGYQVVVLDNLYSGHRWAVHPDADLVIGDAGDVPLVRGLLRDRGITSVVHFAGHIVVPESVRDPLKYYHNNTAVSRNLMAASIAEGVTAFVFSSSAAVYGIPEKVPADETTATAPISPYGTSKLMTEWMLRDLAAATIGTERPFRYIALRYFNVAGARLDGRLGQATPEATHLIKTACLAACGMRSHIDLFGTDYDTPDGTCIRDYIHVEDLADAHLLALKYLARGGASEVLNCGYGKGASVREVIQMVERISGHSIRVNETARRPGDPPLLTAEASRIRAVLAWAPKHQDLEVICRSAYQWERTLQDGTQGEGVARPIHSP